MLMRLILSASTVATVLAGPVYAADLAAPASAPATPSCKTTITFPSYGGVIKQNPDPACLSIGGIGDIYVGGAFTGYAYGQTNPFPTSPAPLPSDREARIDLTNLQAFVQKPDGPLQFYVQVGAYAIPSLGFVDYAALDQTRLLFGPVPVAYGKYQVNDTWSVQAGRMPTLIGSEAPFTVQNLNIARGLLFNQENIITQGVQVNYASGPVSASVAGTDGFFSGELTWFSGTVSYKVDDADTVGVNGGLNLGRTAVLNRSLDYQFATPLLQQNSGIFDLNYTYSKGSWTVTPYVQFTNVERDAGLGIPQGASTFGGATLASYAFTDTFALAGRVEYEAQTGTRGSGTTSLLYGPGSSAFSFTVTPTYTIDRFLVRGEYSHVQLFDVGGGLGFGRSGTRDAQDRVLVEAGITF